MRITDLIKRLPRPTPEELAQEQAVLESIRAIGRAELDELIREADASGATQAMRDAMQFAAQKPRPLLFLDFDDVICVNAPYGGYDVFAPNPPADLYENLWHPPAIQALLTIIDEHKPAIVVTSSWLLLMDRDKFKSIFRKSGLPEVAESLHAAWEAPPGPGSRLTAIERWLAVHHAGEQLVVLDDARSGTGLQGSWLDRAGCVVLCEENVGLHTGHLPAVRAALTSEFEPLTDEQYAVLEKAAPDARGTVLSTLLGDKNGK